MEHHDGFICHALGPVEDQKLRPMCWRSFVRSPHVVGRCGSPLAPSWQAPRACKRRKAVRYTSRTTPHVTCVTRHAFLAVLAGGNGRRVPIPLVKCDGASARAGGPILADLRGLLGHTNRALKPDGAN